MPDYETYAYRKAMGTVDYVPEYGDVATYTRKSNHEFMWEADPWIECSKSYAESCYIHAGISNVQHIIEGPDAQALLSYVSINDCFNWPIGKCKHLVQCDDEGLVVNHGLYTRDAEMRFRSFACSPMEVSTQIATGKWNCTESFEDFFVFQISGPLSLTVIEKALGKNLHDVAFLETRRVSIPGIDSDATEICRIGMSGTLAYELRGPGRFGPEVYDLVYKTGLPFGMKRLGWRTYTVNHTFGGFPQMTCSFEIARFKDEEFRRVSRNPMHISGSIDPQDLNARFRNPVELGWGFMAKFDHSFIGREAVERECKNPTRKIVSLAWNVDDVTEIYRSQFTDEVPYKYMELPSAVQAPAGGHADWVCDTEGNHIGIASVPVYSAFYKMFLCQAVINANEIEEGREVVIQWGDFGGRIKNVRATIEKYPYSTLVENQKYDMSLVPNGAE